MHVIMHQDRSYPVTKESRLYFELMRAGGSPLGEWQSAARYLNGLVRQDEHIRGLIYGYSDIAYTLLIATSQRIIMLIKEATFTLQEQCEYGDITSISVERNGLGAVVALHTRTKDYRIVSFNRLATAHCADYIERRCVL